MWENWWTWIATGTIVSTWFCYYGNSEITDSNNTGTEAHHFLQTYQMAEQLEF